MSTIMAVTYEDAVAVTVESVTGKDPKGPFAALQATTTAGTCNVLTARGTTTTIYLPLGVIVPIAVKGVFSLGTAAGVIGLMAMPYSGGQQ
jgi:hypothetical protein